MHEIGLIAKVEHPCTQCGYDHGELDWIGCHPAILWVRCNACEHVYFVKMVFEEEED